MHFESKLEWARELVKLAHAVMVAAERLRPTGGHAEHHVAAIRDRAAENMHLMRAVLSDVQSQELAAQNAALKAQIKQLKRELADSAKG